MIAARLATRPESMYTSPTSRSTGSPAYRAPSGEKPIAISPRPTVLRCNSTQNATATTTKIGSWVGIPPQRIALSQEQERDREVGEVVRRLRSIPRPGRGTARTSRASRSRPGIRPRVISSPFKLPASAPSNKRRRGGQADRQPRVAPELAEDDRREAHQRADREVDAAADDHRRQRHGQQADLDAQPQHLEGVGEREEVRADRREDRDLDQQDRRQDRLSRLEPPCGARQSRPASTRLQSPRSRHSSH